MLADKPPIKPRFSRFALSRARYILAVVLFVAIFLLGISLSPVASDARNATSRGSGDVALYRAEVERIQAGEGYYQAAAAELRDRGYPTRSVFNWRTPLPMWLIGNLPDPIMGKAGLCLLALALLLAGYELAYRQSGVVIATASVLLLSGALLPCILGELYVMPVLWSGVLIGLSLCAYGLGYSGWGIAAGLGALVTRELAAPYCLLAAWLAWRAGKRRELATWCAGFAAYGVFYAWHAAQVAAVTGPDELAHEHGWLCTGGAPFLLALVQMNGYLLVLPQWVTALYLTLAMVGFASWNSQFGERIGVTIALYLVTFAVVGQPFNQYWGCLLAPSLCFGAARGPNALRDLLAAAGWKPGRPCAAQQIIPEGS